MTKTIKAVSVLLVLANGPTMAGQMPPLLTQEGWRIIQQGVAAFLNLEPTNDAMTVLQGRLQQDPNHPLLRWCSTVLNDRNNQPAWKVQFAEQAALGKASKFDARLTYYQPNNIPGMAPYLDKIGGGGRPAWAGKLGNRWARYGDLAASKKHPFGRVIFIAHLRQSFIVVDRGGAVNKVNHLDVCVPPGKWMATHEKWGSRNSDAWVLGQVGPAAAK